MINSTKFFKSTQENGQVLLFVVITMTIALALGIGLSLETISSISDVADTDTSQRALAAAEGAAERTLTLNNVILEDLVSDLASNCSGIDGATWDSTDSKCYITFTSSNPSQDPIAVRSSVNVSYYDADPIELNSKFGVEANAVHEIFLEGYDPSVPNSDIDLCWNGPAVVYYKVYNDIGESLNNIAKCYGGGCISDTSSPQWQINNDVAVQSGTSLGHPNYQSCTVIPASDMPSNPKGLRIRAMGAAIDGAVYPNPTIFPIQGYKIETQGELINSADIKRDVTVQKSFGYLPIIFDFSFYSKNDLGI